MILTGGPAKLPRFDDLSRDFPDSTSNWPKTVARLAVEGDSGPGQDNAVPPQGTRPEQAITAIGAMGIATCPALIGQRVAFEYAAQLGLSVAEYEPLGKAAAEIRQLYKSICRILDMSTPGKTAYDEKARFG